MKKCNIIFIAYILLCIIPEWVHAQNYILEYDVKYNLDQDRRRWYHGMYYSTTKGEIEIPGFYMYQAQDGASDIHVQGKIFIPASEGPIQHIRSRTGRQKRNTLGIWEGDCSTNTNRDFFVNWSRTQHSFDLTKVSLDWGCFPSDRIDVRQFKMYPDIEINIPHNKFPEEDDFIVNATSGFSNPVYKWQYATRIDSTWYKPPLLPGRWRYTKNWENIPSQLYTHNGKTDTFKASASELLGAQVKDFYGKNVYFRIDLGSDMYTDEITTTVHPSAPHIDSVTYQQPTCYNEYNAKLFVHFNRELYEKETLYVSSDGTRITLPEKRTMEQGSRMIEISGLPADTFNISLYGVYQFGVNASDTINTYTDGDKHNFSIRIPERPAIKLDKAEQDSVHCIGGRDGRILVEASGGTHIFDALLKQNGVQLDSIRFAEGSTAIFKNLPQGDYKVHIIDTNGCRWDENADEVIGSVTVHEPSSRVTIYPVGASADWEEPLGFGLSNGWAQIKFNGGNSTNYNVVWKDSLGTEIPNTITKVGIQYISKVQNIWSSTYTVVVQDANFNDALPKDQFNECGCTDSISFFVTEPPKLEVVVDSVHYVTCHGDKDGVIVAHATGGRQHLTGNMPYTYEWTRVDVTPHEATNGNDSIAKELYSGHYRVKITDRNGITTTSADFHLVQPEPLVVTTNVLQNISCSGQSTGKMEAIATGGTPPYSYIWSNNDTTRVIDNLPQGNYVVGVRDARYAENITGHYCFAQAVDSIMAPNPIKLNPTVKNPVCFGYNNGEIKLNVTGGVPPYTYTWEDGTATAIRSNLPKGDYHIRVSDMNGCFMEEDFTLTNPEKIIVDLGKDFVLCKNQSVNVDGSLPIAGMTYAWTDAANNILSTNANLDISKAGIYKLTATTVDGCIGVDEVRVEESVDEVIPDFVIATEVANNTRLYAVNITRTEVDSISWIIPDDAVILDEQSDRIELLFPDNGSYTIGMAAHRNRCTDILYKSVSVIDQSDIREDTSEEPFLKRFVVTPNPNDGNFQAIVELREPANYKLMLYNSSGLLVETKTINNKINESTSFNVNGKGLYFLKISSPEITSVFKVIIQ